MLPKLGMSYREYIGRRFRYSGSLRLLLEALAKAGINLRPFVLFREGMPDCAPRVPVAGLEGFEVKYLDARDMACIAALAALPGRDISENDLRQRLLAGNQCMALTRNGEMAAFVWCDLANCTFKGYPFALKANEAYLFDSYTFHSFRGKGVTPYLRSRLYRELAQHGRDTCYSVSDRVNRPSLKFKQKLKAQKLVTGIYIVLFSQWRFSLFLKQHASGVPQCNVNLNQQ